MKENKITITDIWVLVIYELINALFVYKYTSRITLCPWAMTLGYLVGVNLFILLSFKNYESRLSLKTQHIIYFSMVAVLTILFTLFMFHFDPQKIRVARYPALYEWLTRLFNFEFPYTSQAPHSGFPFLFMLAMPFYFLGDLGIFQIFSFLIFAVLIHLRYYRNSVNRFRCLTLLIMAPAFLFEIVTRSDLFSNMVIVMLYLAIFEKLSPRLRYAALLILGIVGGFLLSTRGVVGLIYITFFGYYLRRRTIKDVLFFLSILVGFLLTLLPFLIWDWRSFINFGPFVMQMQLSHIPKWLLILPIASCIFCAMSIKLLKSIYSSISFILFGVACLAFAIVIIDCGLYDAVFGDGFDISYFCFALPFLLLSLDFHEKKTTSPNSMFAGAFRGT